VECEEKSVSFFVHRHIHRRQVIRLWNIQKFHRKPYDRTVVQLDRICQFLNLALHLSSPSELPTHKSPHTAGMGTPPVRGAHGRCGGVPKHTSCTFSCSSSAVHLFQCPLRYLFVLRQFLLQTPNFPLQFLYPCLCCQCPLDCVRPSGSGFSD